MRRSTTIGWSALAVTVLAGCASVAPNIRAGSTGVTGVPRLRAVACDADGLGAALPREYADQTYVPGPTGELGGIAAILLSALVTKGVDLLGSKLADRGAEKTRTLEAQLNFDDPAQKVSCFDFARDGLRVRFAMLPPHMAVRAGTTARLDRRYVEFRIIALDYPNTINLEKSGTRGLSVTFEVLKPGSADVASQTVSLRNVEVGSRVSLPFAENPFTSGYTANPFARVETADEVKRRDAAGTPRLVADLPFTLRVRLTELRNANELYKLGAGVVQGSKDDLSTAILKALGVKAAVDAAAASQPGNAADPADGSDAEGQPPGDNVADGNGVDGNTVDLNGM